MRAQVITLVLFLAATALAQQPPAKPAPVPITPEQLESLRRQAAGATHPDEQVRQYIALFEQEIELADLAYNDGDADRGLSLVNGSVSDAGRAREVAVKSHKSIKKLEMHVRRSARRLEDIRRTLAIDDRPPVGKAVEKLQDMSRDLLSKMFASEKD